MSKKVYAVADVDAGWITAGTRYPVLREADGGFYISRSLTGFGEDAFCLWEGCAHLDGGNWLRVEEGE